VAVGRVEDREPGVRCEARHLPLLPGPVEDVGVDRDHQHGLADPADHVVEVAAAARDVVLVHRPRERHVGGGIEAVDELLSLVAEVALHREELLGLGPPPEALLEGGLAPVGEHRHHPRRGEAGVGRLGGVVAAVPPARVGVDGLPLRL
jgi:hypothetical protein